MSCITSQKKKASKYKNNSIDTFSHKQYLPMCLYYTFTFMCAWISFFFSHARVFLDPSPDAILMHDDMNLNYPTSFS